MVVYDLDGDGRAEVCLKAGEGDPRDADGRVQSGPEYLLILDGLTGQEKARAAWPAREAIPDYNYASRNQMCVAYLDGKTPCLIVQRGTYDVMQARAFEFCGGELRNSGVGPTTRGRPRLPRPGRPQLHAADVDADGRDEVLLGSAVLDDNGTGLWSTQLGHPDHFYVGDIDPGRPGLEIYYGIESRRTSTVVAWWTPVRVKSSGGWTCQPATCIPRACVRISTAACPASNATVRTPTARRNPTSAGCSTARAACSARIWTGASARGPSAGTPISSGRCSNAGRSSQYPEGDRLGEIAGSDVGYADVVGDWREELIVSEPGELRIYTTTIPAGDRRVCLMQDPLYRADVCIQAMGYTQCPMTTKCLVAE